MSALHVLRLAVGKPPEPMLLDKTGPGDWRRRLTALIGADYGERVRVGDGWAMLVDDAGLLNGKARNEVASDLYGYQIHGGSVNGTVLLMAEGWSGDGIDWIDVDPAALVAWYEETLRARRTGPTFGRQSPNS